MMKKKHSGIYKKYDNNNNNNKSVTKSREVTPAESTWLWRALVWVGQGF